MKKAMKFVCSIVAGAAAGFGAYCVYKNVIAKKNEEDFDDFDDFDEEANEADENREYVSINITEEESTSEETEEAEETTEVEETTEETPAEEEVEETK